MEYCPKNRYSLRVMKKILMFSPHFYPNDFKCNDVAFDLVKRGYDVTVLCDIPNYPKGKFFPGYGYFRRRREVINGVKVIRTAVIPRGKGGGVMLALNYLSYAFTACLRSIFMGLFCKWDVILVHQLSPVTVGLPAVIVKKMQKRARLLFWVLDLWPESLQVAGGINNKYVLSAFEWVAKLCYLNSDRILISSNGFKDSICQKGDFGGKIVYFPNWAEDSLTASGDYVLPELPDGFKVMFAGNIGEAQDFDHTLEAAKILHDKGERDVHFILVGDGRKRAWVEKYVMDNQLQDIVHWVGRHPLEAMGKFFEQADVLYFALKDSLIFNLTCPAKVQAYMSAGKPVLAMINGEGAKIVEDAACGLSVPAGDSQTLADAICRMASMGKDELEAMGQRGKAYCRKHFSFKDNMRKLLAMFDEGDM